MHDTMTETLTVYEQTCSRCAENLYRVAYRVLGDADDAAALVCRICADGTGKYLRVRDGEKIRRFLFTELVRCLQRSLRFRSPDTAALPEVMRGLSGQERLVSAMRFSSGLSFVESGKILGLSPEKYEKRIREILRRPL